MFRKKANSSKSHRPHANGGVPKPEHTTKRLVDKDGEFRVSLERIGFREKFRRYIGDCFTTFIDLKWRWTLLIIVLGYFLTWFMFGAVYYLFASINGDHRRTTGSSGQPCVTNVYSFTTALLFSVESQHTIGYGYRTVTEKCPHVITLVFFQFIFGVGLQCLIAGLFFAKLQRAKKRSETVMFSRMACISKFNGQLYLAVRVGNIRSSLLLGVRAMGMLVKNRVTTDGGEIPLTQHHIDFFTESRCDSISLLWPAIIYHPIDEKSPLCNANPREVLAGYSELIVVLEGISDSTSKTFQARTSYLPPEVFFNFRLKSIAPTMNSDHAFQISYFDFNMVIPTDVKPKRLLLLRDSSSQTINTGYTSTPLVNELKNWRSFDDVSLNYSEMPLVLTSSTRRDTCIPGREGASGNLAEPPKPVFALPRDLLIYNNGIKSHTVQVSSSVDDISDGGDDKDVFTPGDGDDAEENHGDNNNELLLTQSVDEPDGQDTPVVKRARDGSKIFQVLKLPDPQAT